MTVSFLGYCISLRAGRFGVCQLLLLLWHLLPYPLSCLSGILNQLQLIRNWRTCSLLHQFRSSLQNSLWLTPRSRGQELFFHIIRTQIIRSIHVLSFHLSPARRNNEKDRPQWPVTYSVSKKVWLHTGMLGFSVNLTSPFCPGSIKVKPRQLSLTPTLNPYCLHPVM